MKTWINILEHFRFDFWIKGGRKKDVSHSSNCIKAINNFVFYRLIYKVYEKFGAARNFLKGENCRSLQNNLVYFSHIATLIVFY